jgi:DNA-binding transcriptional MerR regulator
VIWMMHFFPTPYADEILYSILARYSIRCGIDSNQLIMGSIFGKPTARAIMELPFNLYAMEANLPATCPYAAEELVEKHTLYPFFTAFLPKERATNIKKLMLEGNGTVIYGKAGIMGMKVPLNLHLRFCPQCFKEDMETHGEAYWHRLHQVPCVMVCPTHRMLLHNSTVLVRGHNPQAFIPPDEGNCKIAAQVSFDTDELEKFVLLAQDVQYILDNALPHQPATWFAKQYIERFKELGYANINGKVYWDMLIKDFVDYYGEGLLDAVHSNVAKGQGEWIREITHADAKAAHPIRHLLLARFLEIPLKDLFTKELCYKPFGTGPWQCLNPAADHYLEPAIGNVEVKYRRRSKNINGFFSCSCGFRYMKAIKVIPRGITEGQFTKVLELGSVWANKVRELFDSGVSIQEIAARLNADPKTVKKYGEVLKQHNIQKQEEQTKNIHSEFETKRQLHRQRWLKLMQENPDKGRLQLRRLAGYTATWLCKNDREWWEKNSPGKKFVQASNMVDWNARDKEILEVVKHTVKDILESSEKPQRISLRLIKTRSGLKSFDLLLDKLPMTREYIHSVIETPMELHRRRIQWAIRKLRDEKKEFGVYTVVNMVGVGNRYRKQVVEEIKTVLDNL